MYVKSLGAEVKLHRAGRVLTEIGSIQDAYLQSGALRLEVAPGPDGSTAWRVRVDQEPPAELTELVASCVHTTRDALDDLAASLVIASRRTPRHTSFPIAASAHDYAAEEGRCLRRANERARQVVRAVTPWRGADDLLWELRLLDELPGHAPAVELGQVVPPSPVRVPVALQVLQAAAPARGTQHPLHDNSPLVVRNQSASPDDQARLLQATLFLVFGDGAMVLGRPVVDSLARLLTHASSVVDRVVKALERP